MKDLAQMLKDGCHFCRKPLTLESAVCGTMSLRLVGSDVWTEPVPILCCPECWAREIKGKTTPD